MEYVVLNPSSLNHSVIHFGPLRIPGYGCDLIDILNLAGTAGHHRNKFLYDSMSGEERANNPSACQTFALRRTIPGTSMKLQGRPVTSTACITMFIGPDSAGSFFPSSNSTTRLLKCNYEQPLLAIAIFLLVILSTFLVVLMANDFRRSSCRDCDVADCMQSTEVLESTAIHRSIQYFSTNT